MSNYNIILPSKPKIISEKGFTGVYEIDSLYPGYGHTLGNSLRRIILSSLQGTAITVVKIDGVQHEFSTLEGLKEDIVMLLLNLKKIQFKMITDEPQEVTIDIKGPKVVTAKDAKIPGQIEILNEEQYLCETTGKNTALNIVLRIEKGLGYVPKEVLQKDKVEIGTIVLDAVFTPIKRVNYEVENMRVGDRTDYNKLKIFIETDGTLLPREALEESITIMIEQLKAIVGFKEEKEQEEPKEQEDDYVEENTLTQESITHDVLDKDFLKTRIDTLEFSTRTANALTKANIRTIGGLIRKNVNDLLQLEGLGEKGIEEIQSVLTKFGATLKYVLLNVVLFCIVLSFAYYVFSNFFFPDPVVRRTLPRTVREFFFVF